MSDKKWPEMPDKFYEGLGWMHAGCCAALDRGEDPRAFEVGDMVQRCIGDLTRDSEGEGDECFPKKIEAHSAGRDSLQWAVEKAERLEAENERLRDILDRYVCACNEQSINLGSITGDAKEALATKPGEER